MDDWFRLHIVKKNKSAGHFPGNAKPVEPWDGRRAVLPEQPVL